MPIAPQKHEDGDFYIIEVPNKNYIGHALGVQFVNGIARTKYASKAQAFDDQFGYLVWIPEGREPWTLVAPEIPSVQAEWVEEDNPVAKSDLLEEEDFLGDHEDPAPERPTAVAAQRASAPTRGRV